jgi:hypothetical protein
MTNNLQLRMHLPTQVHYNIIMHYHDEHLRPYNTHLFIGFTTEKTLNISTQKHGYRSMCISLATNPTNPKILLQSTPSKVTCRPSSSL